MTVVLLQKDTTYVSETFDVKHYKRYIKPSTALPTVSSLAKNIVKPKEASGRRTRASLHELPMQPQGTHVKDDAFSLIEYCI